MRKIISLNEKEEWRNYYEKLENRHVYADPDYLAFLAWHYDDIVELYVFEYQDTIFYNPIFIRELSKKAKTKKIQAAADNCIDIYSAWYYGGVLVNSDNPPKEAIDAFWLDFDNYLKEKRVVTEFIRCDANIANHRYYPEETIYFNRETVYVDLLQTEEKIWADFSSANRRAYRKALNAGYSVRACSSGDTRAWQQFSDIYTMEMIRKDAPKHLSFDWQYFDKLRSELPGRATLLIIEKNSILYGGFIILHNWPTAFHFLSATNPEHWQNRVNNLVFSEAIFWSKKQGYKRFDFMGGREGVYRFKSNFSTTRGRFFVRMAIHTPERYKLLLSAANIATPDLKISAFPPYLNMV